MPYRMETADNADAALRAASSIAAKLVREGAVPVVLVSAPAAAARVRRVLARSSAALGVRVETFSAWVADRWELFGDGRRIVEPAERTLLVRRALEAAGEGGLHATPGTVDLVAALARDALPQLVRACDEREADLSAGESATLAALARYAEELRARGRCELSEAAEALSRALPAPPPLVALGFDELGCAEEHLLQALSERAPVVRVDDGCLAPDGDPARAPELQALLKRLFKPADGKALAPTGAVRFLLPAGRYAAPALVARAAADAALAERAAADAQGRDPLPVCVTCREPASAFEDAADCLARRGVSSAAAARATFAQTGFGRAFLALVGFACGGEWRVSQASDFALSPFSGVPQRTAYALDAAWRGDRTVDRARIASDLRAASEVASVALVALSGGDVGGALDALEGHLLRRADLDAAYRAEQLAACGCVRRFAAACARTATPLVDALPLLERASVTAGAREDACVPGASGAAGREPAVLFMGLDDAAERPPCSCAVLFACDLVATAYPVRPVENGGTLLMEKLGLCAPADALAASRRRFFRALSSARDAVVCERPLNTVDADDAYPAVAFEELLDCYRADPTRTDDLDRATGLPAALAPFAETAGEDALHENLAPGCDPSDAEAWDVPASGEVSPAARSLVMLPGAGAANATGAALPALSPSAIESYLECPCKWFSLRRLRLSEPDAGFGPLEMGSFSHGVLKSFYEHFIEAGHAKVAPENLPDAQELLRETFARHLAFQPELKRNRNPLVPRTAFERAETHDLERRLAAYLERESALLPGFAPVRFELDFGGAEPFEYAGCALRGSVDRVDVNERGQAVVIDYKGSLSPDYALSSASPAPSAGGVVLPHKVQTLVYAQAVRRLLGLEVVGALYVSYGRDGRVAGAFDRTVVGEGDVPGIDADVCGVPGPACEELGAASFAELVDRVEEGIAAAARSMGAGLVAPDPRGGDPCGFCPVLACERRR